MIEIILLDYLKKKIEVPVLMEKEVRENDYVIIEKTGSSIEDHINSATFAIQSYSESLFGAASLNEKVKKAMEEIIYETDISKAELNTDYNYTDTTTKEYRYQAIYDLIY